MSRCCCEGWLSLLPLNWYSDLSTKSEHLAYSYEAHRCTPVKAVSIPSYLLLEPAIPSSRADTEQAIQIANDVKGDPSGEASQVCGRIAPRACRPENIDGPLTDIREFKS